MPERALWFALGILVGVVLSGLLGCGTSVDEPTEKVGRTAECETVEQPLTGSTGKMEVLKCKEGT